MNNTASSNMTPIEEREMALLNMVNFYVNDIVGSIIFFFGILFNLISFTYFQLSRSFRDTSMRHYFSVLSITDSLRLSEWLFTFLLNKKIIFLSKGLCSIFLFVTITSGHISVWLLVFLSIERYIILQFPFKGKQFYTTRNSLRMLCAVIAILIIADIPYLLPNFIQRSFIIYELHLHMCITNPIYRSYMFINNVLFYSIIPFLILLIFNCLLISLLAKQNSQLFNVIQTENAVLNAKRERQFKERTILLISVTFFLVLTVSPRYIVQMMFVFIQYTSLFKVTISKCLIILEMLNFGVNFLFYILCSKTSRNELYLMLYYFFYWKWSSKSKKYVICNHPNHNSNYSYANGSTMRQTNQSINLANTNQSIYEHEPSMSVFNNIGKKNSRFKIHCFLISASRLKAIEARQSSAIATTTNNTNNNLYKELENKSLSGNNSSNNNKDITNTNTNTINTNIKNKLSNIASDSSFLINSQTSLSTGNIKYDSNQISIKKFNKSTNYLNNSNNNNNNNNNNKHDDNNNKTSKKLNHYNHNYKLNRNKNSNLSSYEINRSKSSTGFKKENSCLSMVAIPTSKFSESNISGLTKSSYNNNNNNNSSNRNNQYDRMPKNTSLTFKIAEKKLSLSNYNFSNMNNENNQT